MKELALASLYETLVLLLLYKDTPHLLPFTLSKAELRGRSQEALLILQSGDALGARSSLVQMQGLLLLSLFPGGDQESSWKTGVYERRTLPCVRYIESQKQILVLTLPLAYPAPPTPENSDNSLGLLEPQYSHL